MGWEGGDGGWGIHDTEKCGIWHTPSEKLEINSESAKGKSDNQNSMKLI